MIRKSIFQEYIAILNLYGPNNRASKYMKQKLVDMKWKIKSSFILETSTSHSYQLIELLNRMSAKI